MEYQREMLIGQWMSKAQNEQGNPFVEHATFFDNGRFELCFMTMSNKGDVLDQVIELGEWGLVGDIHFTTTKQEMFDERVYSADLNNPDNYHAYQITMLNADTFAYQHVTSKESFILKRVIDSIGHC